MEMRDQILQAAAEVVAEKGFDRASVRDIARRAGVAVGTLYLYFPSKDAILDAFVEALAADTEAAAEAAKKVDGRTALEKFLAGRVEFLGQQQGFVRAVLGRAMFDERAGQMVAEKLVEPMLKVIRAAAKGAKLNPQRPALRLCYSLLVAAVTGTPMGLGSSAKAAAAAAARVLAG